MINKTNLHSIQTPSFKANPAQIYRAIRNGAKTCPHAMQTTKQLAGAVEDLGKSYGLKIDIPLRGGKVRETTLAQLPERISDEARRAVDDVVNMVTRPFRHCKDGCNKQGLTAGEVTSNVLVNWGPFKNFNIGNPFTLSAKNPSSPADKLRKAVKGIFSGNERMGNKREAVGLTRIPITNDAQRAALFRNSLKEAGISPDEVNFPSVVRILGKN